MKSLIVDSIRFSYIPKGVANVGDDIVGDWYVDDERVFENVVVVFIAIEDKDKQRQEKRMAKEVVKLLSELVGDKVLLMPNVHLAQNHIAPVPFALKCLHGIKALIEREGITVHMGPFGTFGVWQISSQPTHNSTLGRSF